MRASFGRGTPTANGRVRARAFALSAAAAVFLAAGLTAVAAERPAPFPDWVADAAKKVSRGLGALEKACHAGEPAACADLGFTLLTHARGQADQVRAAAAATKACAGDSGAGCALRGYVEHEGLGVERDPRFSFQAYLDACDLEFAPGCHAAGLAMAHGDGTLHTREGAAKYCARACETGYARDCGAGAPDWCTPGPPECGPRDFACLGRTCEGGDLDDCYRLGIAHVVPSAHLAVAPLRKACEGGMVDACPSLARMFLDGRGVGTKDPARAVELFGRACDGHVVEACADAGLLLYGGGEGLASDPARAAPYLEKACRAEVPFLEACGTLGLMYFRGWGRPRDRARALELTGKACGVSKYCHSYGVVLQAGGTARDREQAYEAYRKACGAGDNEACQARGALDRDTP